MKPNRFRAIEDIEAVLSGERRLPTVVMFNRLEGRPRRRDFSRALRAEVRDPLWMLSRQLQMGEFEGDDAGSPVTAKVRYRTERVTHLHPGGGPVREYDDAVAPLEPAVEGMRPPLALGDVTVALDLRLALGRRWVKLLGAEGLASLAGAFRTAYRFTQPDPDDEAGFPITAHAAAWQAFAAVAGRAMDGGKLLDHLRDPAHRASDGLGLSDPQKGQVDALGDEFAEWAATLYEQPGDPADAAWNPRQLEYQLTLSAPRGTAPRTLVADGYHGGALDWYAFDVAAEPDPAFPAPPDPSPRTPVVTSFMPTGVQFEGMPNTRWWTFEEGSTNLGDVRPDTTDLSKLLLIQFGLVYANDWFLLPIELPVGSLTDVEGLAVTNVFGERYWIEPATSDADESWRRWGMFGLTPRAGGTADPALLLPGSAHHPLEGRPVEAAHLIRDEVSNMVWGVEAVVQLPDGTPRAGREVADELHGRFQRALDEELAANPPPPDPAPNDATIRYQLMNTVPENWIPFTPMHVEGDNREVQLQRAAMPRLLEGARGTPDKVQPRTVLLRQGLDEQTPRTYFVAEEEVSRAGEYVTRRWRRTRWRDGRTFVWLAVDRRTGRGEGSSGLAFDLMVPKAPG